MLVFIDNICLANDEYLNPTMEQVNFSPEKYEGVTVLFDRALFTPDFDKKTNFEKTIYTFFVHSKNGNAYFIFHYANKNDYSLNFYVTQAFAGELIDTITEPGRYKANLLCVIEKKYATVWPYEEDYYWMCKVLEIQLLDSNGNITQTLIESGTTSPVPCESSFQLGRQSCIDDPLSCGIGKYLIFANTENPVLQSGSSVNVYGNNEINKVTLKSGASAKLINFVGSNEVTVQADSTLFNVFRSGATVTFKDSNGTLLTIPATKAPQSIIFNDRTLTLVINNNQVMLGNQVVNLTSSPIL